MHEECVERRLIYPSAGRRRDHGLPSQEPRGPWKRPRHGPPGLKAAVAPNDLLRIVASGEREDRPREAFQARAYSGPRQLPQPACRMPAIGWPFRCWSPGPHPPKRAGRPLQHKKFASTSRRPRSHCRVDRQTKPRR